MNLVAVFCGGGLGAVSRYLISMIVKTTGSGFHLATFLANGLGCFFIGLLTIYFSSKLNCSMSAKLFLTIGFCGGFTTFSTFSNEVIALIKSSNLHMAMIYMCATLAVCLFATMLGIALGKQLM